MMARHADEERVARLLRAQAEAHEPDSFRLRLLLDETSRGDRARTRPSGTRGVTGVRPGRRPALRWLALPAAMVLLGTGSVLAIARTRATPPDDGPRVTLEQPAAPPGTALSTAVPSPPSGSLSATSRPSTAHPSGSTSNPGPSPTGSSPHRSLAAVASVAVQHVGDRHPVVLPAPSDRDWIVTGSRRDGRLVRAKHPNGAALGTVSVTGQGASVVQGPFDVTWSGGIPEQDRSLATTWQSVPVSTGRIRVTAPVTGPRMVLVLSMGTVRTTGLVTVAVPGAPGSGVVRATVSPCAMAVCAETVTITVDLSRWPVLPTGDLVVDLTGADPADGLGVGLAAVELR